MSLVGGFGFTERMAGTYVGRREGFPGGAFHFDVEFDCEDLARSVRDVVGRAIGRITVEGVVADAPTEGVMEVSPFWKRRIRYELAFSGPAGRRYRFEGQKRIRWLSPLKSWTTLPGTITDETTGEIVAEVIARFDIRELGALLRSYRVSSPRPAAPAETETVSATDAPEVEHA